MASKRRTRNQLPRLHLLDLENLAEGRSRRATAQYVAVADAYRRQLGVAARDRVIVGTNAATGLSARYAFPEARVVTGQGPDGADLALLAALEEELAPGRYRALVIGSGDHIFVGGAERAAAFAMDVVVVKGMGALAKRLAMVATRIQVLPRKALEVVA